VNPTYELQDAVGQASSDVDANLDIPLDADLVVFDGLRNVNGYWRDTYLVDRQRLLLLDAQELILFDVAQSYYAVLRAEAQVKVLEGSVQVQEARLRDAQGRADAGVARPLDVAQTQAQVAATRVQLIDAKRVVENSRSLLQLLANAPVKAFKLTDGYDEPEFASNAESLLEIASNHRSELLASARGINAARRDVRFALGAYYPSVSIRLSAFLYRETAPDDRAW